MQEKKRASTLRRGRGLLSVRARCLAPYAVTDLGGGPILGIGERAEVHVVQVGGHQLELVGYTGFARAERLAIVRPQRSEPRVRGPYEETP